MISLIYYLLTSESDRRGISAQWSLLKEEHPGQYIVIATTNTKHLRLFTEAEEWININF